MAKTKRNRGADSSDDESEDVAKELPKTKKAKNTSSNSSGKNEKGEPYWEVCSVRSTSWAIILIDIVDIVILFESKSDCHEVRLREGQRYGSSRYKRVL